MVHRPADSRLLSNLLQQEKEYSKQLAQVIESSNASLTLFAAYAAASAPPTSHVIMTVAGSLAAADEAFRRYAAGVDAWREAMRSLKDAEEEVANIMRDREILVTRLIKASKSPKSGTGSIRESLLLGVQHFPSSSSLTLSATGNSDTPSPTPSRPLSASFSSSTKLAAAQSELQACEAHLAAKERELAMKRNVAIRDGLGARIRAMIDCGQTWHELGKGALQSLDELKVVQPEQKTPQHDIHIHVVPNNSLHVPDVDSTRPSSDFSSIGPSQSASQIDALHELPPPISMAAVMNSGAFDDFMPNKPMPTVQADAQPQRPASHTSTTTGSSIFSNPVPTTYQVETVTYAPAIAVRVPGASKETGTPPNEPRSGYASIPIPAPHALDGYAYGIPTATAPPPVAGPSGLQKSRAATDSGYSTPQYPVTPQAHSSSTPQFLSSAFHSRHVLERRITEDSQEDRRRNSVQEDEISSFDEVNEQEKLVQQGKIAVVENPRFMTEARRREIEKEKERVARKEEEERKKEKGKQREIDVAPEQRDKEPGKEKKRFAFFHQHAKSDKTQHPRHDTRTSAPHDHDQDDERVSPSKVGFLGSLRGLFAKPLVTPSSAHASPRIAHTDRGGDEEYSDTDSEPSPTKASGRGLQGLFRSPDKSNKARPSATSAQWNTRTDKNIKQLSRQTSLDDGLVAVPNERVGLGLAGSAVTRAGVVSATGVGLPKTPKAARGRTVSDSGAIATGTSRADQEKATPGYASKRLKKPPRGAPPPVSAPPAQTPKKAERRSASMDDYGVNNRRKSWVDDPEPEDDGMIVDLGRRRRVASEAGTPPSETDKRLFGTGPTSKPVAVPQLAAAAAAAAAAASTSPKRPADVFGPTGSTTKGYSSDTAAMQPSSGGIAKKKKSLTKKRELGKVPAIAASSTPQLSIPAAPAPIRATSTTPMRKASVKSTTPASKVPLSQPQPQPQQIGPAIVLAAGGEHPSGVLVQQPGWNTQAQAQGGTLSRNNSIASAASAPVSGSGGGSIIARGSGKKKTALGQGVGGSGGVARRASLTGASPGKAEGPSRPATSVMQPLPPALNLMSIIEDVARTNREGWTTPESKTRKSGGGGQQMAGGMIEVVKAPPPMERARLEALGATDIRRNWGAGSSTVSLPTKTVASGAGSTSRTGMFEIKAPGSVFDQRQADVAQKQQLSRSTVGQGMKYGQPATSEAQAGAGVTTSGHQPVKSPLRSALRNSSRSPSPAARPSPSRNPPGSSPLQYEGQSPLPPPVEGDLPWGSDGTLHQPRKIDKGNALARLTDDDETDQSGDESNEVFYSDLEEVETVSKSATPQVHAAAPIPSGMNGHAFGHTKTPSELSQSSTSTFIPGLSSSARDPRVPSLANDQQTPRRRKSVRVSLQPTFSPSPPAIEYDYEEEQRLHAPWAWNSESMSKPVEAPLPAPVPLRAPVKTVATSEEPDMWADSSDEDEQYVRAKRLLTRAAKKERDAKVLANSVH